MVKDVCGEKLQLVKDENWKDFTKLIQENIESLLETPSAYYKYYYWDNIISSMLSDKSSS